MTYSKMLTVPGGQAPALAFSFQFTEQQPETKPMPFMYYLREAENPYSLKAWHKQSHEVVRAVFEAGWCPKGCGGPKEQGWGNKGLGIFSTAPEALRENEHVVLLLLYPSSLAYESRHRFDRRETASKILGCHTPWQGWNSGWVYVSLVAFVLGSYISHLTSSFCQFCFFPD